MTGSGYDPESTEAQQLKSGSVDEREKSLAAARGLKGFGLHLAGYFGTMIILVPVNFYFSPENPWFLLPMVGWGSVLGLHAAYAMGLFHGLFGK